MINDNEKVNEKLIADALLKEAFYLLDKAKINKNVQRDIHTLVKAYGRHMHMAGFDAGHKWADDKRLKLFE